VLQFGNEAKRPGSWLFDNESQYLSGANYKKSGLSKQLTTTDIGGIWLFFQPVKCCTVSGWGISL
jgi:hypothetical protein